MTFHEWWEAQPVHSYIYSHKVSFEDELEAAWRASAENERETLLRIFEEHFPTMGQFIMGQINEHRQDTVAEREDTR